MLASPVGGRKQESPPPMELTLQTLAPRCHVSGRDFIEGDRVTSFLVRGAAAESGGGKAAAESVARFDVLTEEAGRFAAPGPVVCRWGQVFKPRRTGENTERALKLTAETLFLALSEPSNEPAPENERLRQVLAMMLERKRVLRLKGTLGQGAEARQIFEHAKTKNRYEVRAAELSPEFFLSIQEQLAALVGGSPGGG